MKYFAYGSNMKTKRLENRRKEKRRIGKVNVIGKAELKNYRLTFNKLSKKDGTGKANIEQEEGSLVEGVLFDLTEGQLEILDYCEGVPTHYIRRKMNVVNFDNNIVQAEVYIANPNKIRSHLKLKCKYLQYLIDGAKEHGLSEQYKEFLESVECTKNK